MRNRIGNVLWGLIFILIGVGFVGNVLWGWDFELFFSGWWTLFIIVPCGISVVQRGPRVGNMIGICIGVLLLLSKRFHIDYFGDLIVPTIFIIIGVSFLFKDRSWNKFGCNTNTNTNTSKEAYSDNRNQNTERTYNKEYKDQNGNVDGQVTTILSSKVIDFSNQLFQGITLNSVLGGITLDLRNAEIRDGSYIDIAAVLGGVDIVVPPDVEVRVQQVPILGGVTNKAMNRSVITSTVFVNATCIMGGVMIK